eukprot:TRINITY_DN2650_c0_g2_i1.p1 TRINITY_DN2650_c0_g2~~TRINITY_DN2650_c0_g2_i1.p1  ORF type:complete len:362 (-),score=114.34 TRINITY_DN2650_c0_g2_i1:56-1099(-)
MDDGGEELDFDEAPLPEDDEDLVPLPQESEAAASTSAAAASKPTPGSASGGGAAETPWDARRIAQAVASFGLCPEMRPADLGVDAEGRFALLDLMQVWGNDLGLEFQQVLDALRQHMFYSSDGMPVLRFTLASDEYDDVVVRVHPPKDGSAGFSSGGGRAMSSRRPANGRQTPYGRGYEPQRRGYGGGYGGGYGYAPYQRSRQEMRMLEQPRFFRWQNGSRFCRLCHQWADDGHVLGKRHAKRALTPEWYLTPQQPGVKAKVETIDLIDDDDEMVAAKVELPAVDASAVQEPPSADKVKTAAEMSREELIARVEQLEAARQGGEAGEPAEPAEALERPAEAAEAMTD